MEIGISDGRLNSYTLGDERATSLLARIYANIPTGGIEIRFDELLRRVLTISPKRSVDEVRRGLVLLQKHRIAVVRKHNGGRK